jgi:hypothetical protein
MEKVIFFNVGWMERYQGNPEQESIKGGGKFVDKNGYGYEMFNFLPFNGHMYGYVQPTNPKEPDFFKRTINIDKLGASKKDSSVDDVLGVWVALKPDGGGTRVIGWYSNSTIYRKYQQAPAYSNRIHRSSNIPFGYYATAKAEDCVCLPVEERHIKVPRSENGSKSELLGTSNVWYADSKRETVTSLIAQVKEEVLRHSSSDIASLNRIRPEVDLDVFNKSTLEDAREWILTSIVRRQGQSQFRRSLLEAYKGKCAISDCNVEQALEAAHIIPYRGEQTNVTSNGLLLRADLHTLFDLKLITIDPQTMRVLAAPELMQTTCRAFHQKMIKLPDSEAHRPNQMALESHYSQCRWTRK